MASSSSPPPENTQGNAIAVDTRIKLVNWAEMPVMVRILRILSWAGLVLSAISAAGYLLHWKATGSSKSLSDAGASARRMLPNAICLALAMYLRRERSKDPGFFTWNAFTERWYPTVTTSAGALVAIRQGVVASWFVAGMTVWSLVLGVLPITLGSAFTLAFYLLLAWRISRQSRAWAIAGLGFFIADRLLILWVVNWRILSPVEISIRAVCGWMYFNAVRGTFAIHRRRALLAE